VNGLMSRPPGTYGAVALFSGVAGQSPAMTRVHDARRPETLQLAGAGLNSVSALNSSRDRTAAGGLHGRPLKFLEAPQNNFSWTISFRRQPGRTDGADSDDPDSKCALCVMSSATSSRMPRSAPCARSGKPGRRRLQSRLPSRQRERGSRHKIRFRADGVP
jgi:hypothetical protein